MPSSGKRGSYRVIIAHKSGTGCWIFVYGFSKSEHSNIGHDDLLELKELAKDLLSIPIDKLSNILIEIKNEK